jgi:hypothetical protein
MIFYTVKHHIHGRIRVHIPLLKSMTMPELKSLAEKISGDKRPEGIKDISANPLTGSVTITYDPSAIDINAYIKDLALSEELQHLTMPGKGDRWY